MKRTMVWIDDADKDSVKVRKMLKAFLDNAGLTYTIFEAVEVMESEKGFMSK
jgi:hypothetical protein